jgi:hypothetical protein
MRKLLFKSVYLLMLVASMFVLSSCDLLGGDEEINEADLIGSWDIGQPSVDIKVGPISMMNFLMGTMQFGEEAAQLLVDELTAEFVEFDGTITFNNDYTCLFLQGELEENGEWELADDELYLTVIEEVPNETPLIIRSLSASAAVVAWEQDQELDINEDGEADFTATIIIELNLSKQ